MVIQSSISVSNKSDNTNEPETKYPNTETAVNNHFQTNTQVSFQNGSIDIYDGRVAAHSTDWNSCIWYCMQNVFTCIACYNINTNILYNTCTVMEVPSLIRLTLSIKTDSNNILMSQEIPSQVHQINNFHNVCLCYE